MNKKLLGVLLPCNVIKLRGNLVELPPKDDIGQAFQKLYYRLPTEDELTLCKVDMQGERVIFMKESE